MVFKKEERKGEEREKIGGFWMRVVKEGKMKLRMEIKNEVLERVEVWKKDGRGFEVGIEKKSIERKKVREVVKIGDEKKELRIELGEIEEDGEVKEGKMEIGCWVKIGKDMKGEEKIFRKIDDGKMVGSGRKDVVGKRIEVDGKDKEIKLVKVEKERSKGGSIGEEIYGESWEKDGFLRIKCEVEFSLGYGVRCMEIILEKESMEGLSKNWENIYLK